MSDARHHRNRYYSPKLGRFISRDSRYFDDGANLYAYCHNNAVDLSDPFGTSCADQIYNDYLNALVNNTLANMIKMAGDVNSAINNIPNELGATSGTNQATPSAVINVIGLGVGLSTDGTTDQVGAELSITVFTFNISSSNLNIAQYRSSITSSNGVIIENLSYSPDGPPMVLSGTINPAAGNFLSILKIGDTISVFSSTDNPGVPISNTLTSGTIINTQAIYDIVYSGPTIVNSATTNTSTTVIYNSDGTYTATITTTYNDGRPPVTVTYTGTNNSTNTGTNSGTTSTKP